MLLEEPVELEEPDELLVLVLLGWLLLLEVPWSSFWLVVDEVEPLVSLLSSRQINNQRINQITTSVTTTNTASHTILPTSDDLSCSYIDLPLAYIGTVSE